MEGAHSRARLLASQLPGLPLLPLPSLSNVATRAAQVAEQSEATRAREQSEWEEELLEMQAVAGETLGEALGADKEAAVAELTEALPDPHEKVWNMYKRRVVQGAPTGPSRGAASRAEAEAEAEADAEAVASPPSADKPAA